MTDLPPVNEKYTGTIGEVVLGKGDYIVGGAKGMPFLSFEHRTNRRPIVAGEVYDTLVDYPELAANMFDGRQKDPVEWAYMWKTLSVDMICVRLASLDPAKGGTTPEAAAELVKKISDKTGLPIIVSGCGILDIDIPAFTAISAAVTDSRLILSKVDEDEYKKLATVAIANNHVIIGFANLDVNLSKQMNILLTDFGVKKENILTDPLMAPLGMGLDYSYSVNERIRISGLMGDKMLQQPLICDCTDSWNVSDAINEEDPSLGDARLRATWWEAMTAMSAIVSGADMVIMRGPGAADMILGYCDELRDVI